MSDSQPRDTKIQADPSLLSLHLTEPNYEVPRLEVPAEKHPGAQDVGIRHRIVASG